jgi:hypothetical protein
MIAEIWTQCQGLSPQGIQIPLASFPIPDAFTGERQCFQ